MKTDRNNGYFMRSFVMAAFACASLLTVFSGCDEDWEYRPPLSRNDAIIPASLDLDGNAFFGVIAVGGSPISGDGRYVTFATRGVGDETDATLAQVYRVDLQDGSSKLISSDASGAPGDRDSGAPSIDSDGDTVTFASFARNLAPGLDLPSVDIYDPAVYTWEASTDAVKAAGAFTSTNPSISADGNTICFRNNDLPVCLDTRNNQTTIPMLLDDDTWDSGEPAYDFLNPVVNRDGTVIALVTDRPFDEDDDNGLADVYVFEASGLNTPQRVSILPDGKSVDCESHQPVLSADGSMVAFTSCSALGFTDGITEDQIIYLFNRRASTLTALMPTNPPSTPAEDMVEWGNGWRPSISADGRYVSFEQYMDGEWGILVWDLERDMYAPVVNGHIFDASDPDLYRGAAGGMISADGTTILFAAYTSFWQQWSRYTLFVTANPLFQVPPVE